ncbi:MULTISPECIES: ABC transporter substrate-binding protein [unclassified Nocardiopsis]|uniref:ABC transporter substrate-binding protein n=1 Tax=Nocardiopsis TaxID=2013 RepID=UPI00387B006F
MSKRTTVFSAAAAALALSLAATACGGAEGGGDGGGSGDGASVDSLTLGYFPNITHVPALVGVENGIFAESLGDVELNTQTFNAGPDVINALFAGEVDISFIGPNPAINGWSQSDGTALHIIAGSTSGGAGLVVRPGIEDVEDLPGTTISTPQLGNTQDVALRWFAQEQGWEADTEGGGDLSIVPQGNAEIIDAFALGEIDGAWVPEPHLSRLILENEGELLIDEADLWPDTGGEFVTTHIIVNADFLEQHPDVVEAFLRGHIETVDWVNENPEEAQQAAITHLEALTGSAPSADVVAASFENVTFTFDPISPSLRSGAEHAEAVGLLDPVELEGIYSLDLLNGLLSEDGRDEVAGF